MPYFHAVFEVKTLSITKTRTFIEKSGCGYVTGIVLMIVLIVGMVYYGFGNRNDSPTASRPQTVVAAVGKHEVYLEDIQEATARATENLVQSNPAFQASLGPEFQAMILADQVVMSVNEAVIAEIAGRENYVLTDEKILQLVMEQVDSSILQLRFQMMQQGMLKPDATEQDFQAALKLNVGKDVAELKAEAEVTAQENLKKPEERRKYESQFLGMGLLESYRNKTKVSDDELKKSFDTWITKRVFIDPTKHTDEDPHEIAERVRAEIEGGLAFESAMEKYSDDTAPEGKTKSESNVNYTLANLTYDDSIRPIMDLKKGEVSEVLWTSSGPAVYKLIDLQPKVPENFEELKENFRSTRVNEIASKKLQDEMKQIIDGGGVQWQSEALKIAFEWARMRNSLTSPKGKKEIAAALLELENRALEVVQENADIVGGQPPALILYAIFNQRLQSLPEAERSSLDERKLEVLSIVTEFDASADLLIELAELRLAKGDGPGATDALKQAAQANADFTTVGEGRYTRIQNLRNQLVAKKLASEEDAAAIDTELATWRIDLADYLVYLAESNQDFGDMGQSAYNEINSRLAALISKGWISDEAATEVRRLQSVWREEKLKFDKEEEQARKEAEEEAKAAEAEKAKEPGPTGGTPPSSFNPLPGPAPGSGN
ncbi:MAG: peptidylprolyl isomerase [Armatimonadetes bacterium OLB18]|nr:MAG: peptidylprolyl isomerase [Armatimonadetes bacterium OLB18]